MGVPKRSLAKPCTNTVAGRALSLPLRLASTGRMAKSSATPHANAFSRNSRIRCVVSKRTTSIFTRCTGLILSFPSRIQPPYNLFERKIERGVLPYALGHGITALTYGALCRGLLSGAMNPDRQFAKDDMRKTSDPKFQAPHFAEYLNAASKLDAFARKNFDKHVIHLAVRWLLDQPGVGVAFWGARRPEQLAPIREVIGWSLTKSDYAAIDAILRENIRNPVGPEFMAPPTRKTAGPVTVSVG